MNESKIITPCEFPGTNCLDFNKVNDLVIQLVNEHYYDLQIYANEVFYIDNGTEPVSNKNNFSVAINNAIIATGLTHPTKPLFDKERMLKLLHLVALILTGIKSNIIQAKKYVASLRNITFFGSGDISPSILFQADRIGPNKEIVPIIIKLVPLQYPHQYPYLPYKNEQLARYKDIYIEAPAYALFFKEAWMSCFAKNKLTIYTPTFACIANCFVIEGWPVHIDQLESIYEKYINKLSTIGEKPKHKKWLAAIIDSSTAANIKEDMLYADYGCLEMVRIEGTLEELLERPNQLTLSMIFEYLYTKLVAAFIGRIIFTDDHMGNVAYITVDYYRDYQIKCNGCSYHFYMPPGEMIQFIDLERYIFNFSQYDVYTNNALRKIKKKDLELQSEHIHRVQSSYETNTKIFDKTLDIMKNTTKLNETHFVNPEDYDITMNIINSQFSYDIKTFCQIMEIYLPSKYLTDPKVKNIVAYSIDLDDDSKRIIQTDQIYKLLK